MVVVVAQADAAAGWVGRRYSRDRAAALTAERGCGRTVRPQAQSASFTHLLPSKWCRAPVTVS